MSDIKLPSGFKPVNMITDAPSLPQGFSPFGTEEEKKKIYSYLDDPEETEAKIELSKLLADVYRHDPDRVFRDVDTYRKATLGDAPNNKTALQNFRDLFKYNMTYQKIFELRAQQVYGDETPETEQRIQELKSQLPDAEQVRKMTPPSLIELSQDQEGNIFQRIASAIKERKQIKREMEAEGELPGFAERSLYAVANVLPSQITAAEAGARWGLNTANSFAIGSMVLGVAAPPAIPAAWAAGLAKGWSLGSVKKMAEIEAGAAYDRFVELQLETGEKLNPKLLKVGALGIGIVAGALESIELGGVIKHTGLQRLIGKAASETLNQKAVLKGIGGVVVRTIKNHGEFVAKESGVEVLQDAVHFTGEALIKAVNNKVEGTELETEWNELIPQLWETWENSVLAFNVMGGAGSMRTFMQETAEMRGNRQEGPQIEIQDNITETDEPASVPIEQAVAQLREIGWSDEQIERNTRIAYGENSKRYKEVREIIEMLAPETTVEPGNRDWFAGRLQLFFPAMTEKQLQLSMGLIEQRAEEQGITADQYIVENIAKEEGLNKEFFFETIEQTEPQYENATEIKDFSLQAESDRIEITENPRKENAYIKARSAGIEHNQAMVYSRGIAGNKDLDTVFNRIEKQAMRDENIRSKERFKTNVTEAIEYYETKAEPEIVNKLKDTLEKAEYLTTRQMAQLNRRLKATDGIPDVQDQIKILEGEYTIGELGRSFEKGEWTDTEILKGLIPENKEELTHALANWGAEMKFKKRGIKEDRTIQALGLSGLWKAAAVSAVNKGKIKDSLANRLLKEVDNNPEKYEWVFANLSGPDVLRAWEMREQFSPEGYKRGKKARDRLRKAERADIRRKQKRLREEAKKTAEMYPEQEENINQLLEDIDLVRLTPKKKVELSRLKDRLQEGDNQDVSGYLLNQINRLDKRNITELTVKEFNQLHDAVMHEIYKNRERQRVRVGNQKMETAHAVESSIKEMKPPKEAVDPFMEKIESKGAKKEPGKAWEMLSHIFGVGQLHYDLLVEMLAGKNSTMDKVFFTAVKQGTKNSLKYVQDTFSTFNEAMVENGVSERIKNIDRWLNEKVEVGRFKLTRNERMSLYRHSLNPDNRRSIIDGGIGFKNRGATERNKVYRITETELEQIIDSLTEDEKLFAGEAVTELFEKQYQDLNKVFLQKNGFRLPPIEEGLYYPKDTMPVVRGATLETEIEAKAFSQRQPGIGLEKGMLIERKDVTIPIYLNPLTTDINKSVRDAGDYIGLEIPLSNAAKVLYNKQFKSEFLQRYGSNVYREIEKGLRDIAGNRNMYSMLESAMMKAKNNLSTAFLGFNPAVMLKQVLSFPAFTMYVKPKHLMHGFVRAIYHNKEVQERHKMYSPEFMQRVEGGFNRDVAEALASRQEKKIYSGKKDVREISMQGIQFLDKRTVMAGMEGAVQQVLEEFQEGHLSAEVSKALDMTDEQIQDLSPNEKMGKAYEYAEYAVQRTQPVFSPEHRSGFSRGTVVEKMLSMFSSFTNQGLNALVRAGNDVLKQGGQANMKKFASALTAFMIISPIGAAVIDKLKDEILSPDQDDEEIWKRYIHNVLGYIYIARDLERSLMSKIDRGTWMGYGLSLPVGRLVNDGVDMLATFARMFTEKDKGKEAKKLVDNTAQFISVLYGLPYPALRTYVMQPIREYHDKFTLKNTTTNSLY